MRRPSFFSFSWLTQPFSPLFLGEMGATSRAPAPAAFCRSLSVPYSSGRWVRLLIGEGARPSVRLSVPYSSGRWVRHGAEAGRAGPAHFQSPIPRGDGCDGTMERRSLSPARLSVPYSSGRWVRRGGMGSERLEPQAFSPLFLGEMGATPAGIRALAAVVPLSVPYSSGRWVRQGDRRTATLIIDLSVPYSSGRWVRRCSAAGEGAEESAFQSPIPRGDGCDTSSMSGDSSLATPFSPLFLGEMGATQSMPRLQSGF